MFSHLRKSNSCFDFKLKVTFTNLKYHVSLLDEIILIPTFAICCNSYTALFIVQLFVIS